MNESLQSVTSTDTLPIIPNINSNFIEFEDWKKRRVVIDEKIMSGVPVFKGTRIPVVQIKEQVKRGLNDEIKSDYYDISDEDLRFVLMY